MSTYLDALVCAPADSVLILIEAEEGYALRGIMDFWIAVPAILIFLETSGWAFSYPIGWNNLPYVTY